MVRKCLRTRTNMDTYILTYIGVYIYTYVRMLMRWLTWVRNTCTIRRPPSPQQHMFADKMLCALGWDWWGWSSNCSKLTTETSNMNVTQQYLRNYNNINPTKTAIMGYRRKCMADRCWRQSIQTKVSTGPTKFLLKFKNRMIGKFVKSNFICV